jgi:hypothetical protein
MRLWSNADWLDQEWTAAPIPADGVGKEIIVRTSTDLQTSGSVICGMPCALEVSVCH